MKRKPITALKKWYPFTNVRTFRWTLLLWRWEYASNEVFGTCAMTCSSNSLFARSARGMVHFESFLWNNSRVFGVWNLCKIETRGANEVTIMANGHWASLTMQTFFILEFLFFQILLLIPLFKRLWNRGNQFITKGKGKKIEKVC